MNKQFKHGEVTGIELNELPSGCKPVKVIGDFVVVAESEVTGNDHRILLEKNKDKVEFFEKDGILYMKNLVDVTITCPNPGHHAQEIIPRGIWKIKKGREIDHLTEIVKELAD